MGQIHENYCSQIFSNLNYVIQQEVGEEIYIYTDIRQLENYGLFVAKSTDDIVIAYDLIQFAELANLEYNKELVKYDQLFNTSKGGVKRNKKMYKKTRKNKSTKRTPQKRNKRNTRKLKKTKSRRKLRYNKIY
jgi:hypothetical protein